MNETSVVFYRPEYRQAFVDLNREWIEKYFRLEPMDLFQLENPESSILAPGGDILFVVRDGIPVGTCALVPHGTRLELAKMAVAPSARGAGLGDVLMKAAIERARERGAGELMLLSNTVLAPAISLYHKHGFRTVRLGQHPDYERCNIEMERTL